MRRPNVAYFDKSGFKLDVKSVSTNLSEAITVLTPRGRPKQNLCIKRRICFTILLSNKCMTCKQ